jgi:uncharacterized protein YndB with AHSA1/START domain
MEKSPDDGLHRVSGSGSVQVGVSIDRSPAEAWKLITERAALAHWFADADRSLDAPGPIRFDFGDGDFFAAECETVQPGELVAFTWSFLGIGQLDRITWTLEPEGAGVRFTAADRNPGRSPAENQQLLDGWSDFLTRLRDHADTGHTTRYELRDDIDGAVDLPADGFAPLREDTAYRWLPIASDGFAPCWFFVVDDEGPRRFPLRDWRLVEDRSLSFVVELPGAAISPRCTVELTPAGSGRRLRFAQTGWNRVDLPVLRRQELRQRFAAAWIAACDGARTLATARDAAG